MQNVQGGEKAFAVLIGALTVTFPPLPPPLPTAMSPTHTPFPFACLSRGILCFKKGLKKCRGRRGLCRAVAGNLSGLYNGFAALLTARLIMDLLCGENAAASLKRRENISSAPLLRWGFMRDFRRRLRRCQGHPSDYQELSNAVELKNLSPLSSVASSLYIFWKFLWISRRV